MTLLDVGSHVNPIGFCKVLSSTSVFLFKGIRWFAPFRFDKKYMGFRKPLCLNPSCLTSLLAPAFPPLTPLGAFQIFALSLPYLPPGLTGRNLLTWQHGETVYFRRLLRPGPVVSLCILILLA